jgi:hypothetical protein
MRHYATQNACHELLAKSSIMWAPADFAQLPFGQHRDQSERRSHDRPSDHVLKYDVLQRRLPPYLGCASWMGSDEGRVGVGESDERPASPYSDRAVQAMRTYRADENGLLPTAHCPGQSKTADGSSLWMVPPSRIELLTPSLRAPRHLARPCSTDHVRRARPGAAQRLLL